MGSDFNRLRRRDRLHFAIDTGKGRVYKSYIRRVDCLIGNPFVSGLRFESQGNGGRPAVSGSVSRGLSEMPEKVTLYSLTGKGGGVLWDALSSLQG